MARPGRLRLKPLEDMPHEIIIVLIFLTVFYLLARKISPGKALDKKNASHLTAATKALPWLTPAAFSVNLTASFLAASIIAELQQHDFRGAKWQKVEVELELEIESKSDSKSKLDSDSEANNGIVKLAFVLENMLALTIVLSPESGYQTAVTLNYQLIETAKKISETKQFAQMAAAEDCSKTIKEIARAKMALLATIYAIVSELSGSVSRTVGAIAGGDISGAVEAELNDNACAKCGRPKNPAFAFCLYC
jgi:hypothetical protein